MKTYIADPKSKTPESKMPTLKVAPNDLDDIVAFLATLKEPAKK